VNWDAVLARAEKALDRREVVGAPLSADYPAGWLDRLFRAAAARGAPVLPVRVDVRDKPGRKTVYLTAGAPLPAGATPEAAGQAIERLGEAGPAGQKEKAAAH